MKLTPQEEQCLKLFRDNDNIVTTGMFLKTTLSAEYRKIISLLRKKGYEIPAPILNRSQPGLNQYTLIEGKMEHKKKAPIIQVSEQCQKCGSFYRRGEECNVCQ